MQAKRGFRPITPAVRTVMAVVVMAAGLGLAGCGDQMAKLEESQLRLQAITESNAEQITAIAERMEQNQTALQAKLENLQSNLQQVAAKTTAISQEQLRLQQQVQDDSRGLTAKVAALEQSLGLLTENQNELRAGMENMRNDAGRASAEVASDVKAVAQEQTRLHEMVQTSSRQLADNVAVIEQNQQQWQGKMEGLHEKIQQVAAAMDVLGKDLLTLQETLQRNVRDLVGMMEAAGQNQLKSQEKTQANLKALEDSLSTLRQSQNKLQIQIEAVQSRSESLGREVPEALAKMADELARLSIVERAQTMDGESSSPSPPPDSDGSER